jgi:serine/threonine-protein kinase
MSQFPPGAAPPSPPFVGAPPRPFPPGTFGPPAWQPPLPRPRRSRAPWIVAGGAVVLVAAVIAAVLFWPSRPAPPPPPTVALTELDDGVMIGYPDAATTIDIFDEPICPPCSRFVTSSALDIERAVNAHKLAVRYHLLNFLANNSASGDYSTRAVAASYCVAEAKNPKMYVNFYVDLFAANFQPAEGGRTDRTDAELAHLAQTVGAPTSAADCIQQGRLVSTAKTKASHGQSTLTGLATEASTPQAFNGTHKIDISAPSWVDTLG